MRFIYIIILFAGVALWTGCNTSNPKEPIPTYIHIDSFKFNPTIDSQGTSSHDIKTIFVYYNNSPIGVFDLPATFPVIADGIGKLEVAPGIAEDGLSGFQGAYPFYTLDTFSFTANPGATIYHTPVTGYFPATRFPFKDDFEVSNLFAFLDGTDSIVITHDADKVFEGHGVGYVHMSTDSALCEELQNQYPFAITGVTYLEFNYSCNVPFTIGLLGTVSGIPFSAPYYIGGLNASAGVWKKAYFNLSEFPSIYAADNYRVAFKTVLPTGQASGFVLLDNVKVVTF